MSPGSSFSAHRSYAYPCPYQERPAFSRSCAPCADDIVDFVKRFTTHVEGVGDICSLAAFNLQVAFFGS